MRKSNEKLCENDIKSLEDISDLLNVAEEGNKFIESFKNKSAKVWQFNGKDVSNMSVYQQFVKLMYNSSDKSLQEAKEDIAKNKTNLSDLIDYSRNGDQLSADIKEKIGQVKVFLSNLNRAYQSVFCSSMNF